VKIAALLLLFFGVLNSDGQKNSDILPEER
jgi:hypothetical protein